MAYLQGGAGQVVVLLQGFGSEKDHWARFARHLTRSYRVIIPDIPGFGESSKVPSASYDMQSQARRIGKLCSSLGLERFHLAGNSMGGCIAALVAAHYADRVMTLALIDSSGVTPLRKSEFQHAWDRGQNLLLIDSIEDFDRMMALNFTKEPFIPRPLRRVLAQRASYS